MASAVASFSSGKGVEGVEHLLTLQRTSYLGVLAAATWLIQPSVLLIYFLLDMLENGGSTDGLYLTPILSVYMYVCPHIHLIRKCLVVLRYIMNRYLQVQDRLPVQDNILHTTRCTP
jgi:hypothetical protein